MKIQRHIYSPLLLLQNIELLLFNPRTKICRKYRLKLKEATHNSLIFSMIQVFGMISFFFIRKYSS